MKSPKEQKELDLLRHSAAHLLAQAVLELYPTTQLTIGPVTTEGFFYDFLPETNFKEEDLPKIEKKMHEIAARDLKIEQKEISKDEARKLYKDNPFKLELIDGIEGNTVGIAVQGDFYDLCKGGHVSSTGQIKHFKLLGLAGAYWRADKNNATLQRISGTAFPTQKELDEYLQMREDALKYDHRKLGKQLDLFSFHEEGPGFVFFHPKGKTIVNIMTNYLRKLLDEAGYQEIGTPMILSEELWKQSGHYAHYKNNMYFCDMEDRRYAVKPMNCPGHLLIYNERPRSYRELPLRLAEFGLVHRYELSGVLHGMTRVRAFTQDDAHIFCEAKDVEQEVLNTIKLIYVVLNKFGFSKVNVGVSTRPENSMGSDELWEKATKALTGALKKANIEFEIYEGEGAFYGPKIEFGIEDSMKRSWQCSTVQVDFFMPENFDLTYVASSGKKERPVMVHRAIYGSLERFFAVLLEHYRGNLPFWLAPIQAKILTITDEQKEYARTLAKKLREHNIRVTVDDTSDPLSGQIKTAQLERIPWMLIVGKKEVEKNAVTIRYLDGKQEMGVDLDTLVQKAITANQQ